MHIIVAHIQEVTSPYGTDLPEIVDSDFGDIYEVLISNSLVIT